MNKTVKVGVASAGLLLVGGSPAAAVGGNWTSLGNIGIGNGIQANVPVQAPINLCGNAIGLLGPATASCIGGANALYSSNTGRDGGGNGFNVGNGGNGFNGRSRNGGGNFHGQQHHRPGFNGQGGGQDVAGGWNTGDWTSLGNIGIANGIQASVPIQAPINVCGNAIALFSDATAACINSGANALAFSTGDNLPGTGDNNNGNGFGNNNGNGLGNANGNGYGNGNANGNGDDDYFDFDLNAQNNTRRHDHRITPKAAIAPKANNAAKKAPELGLIGDPLSPVTELLGVGEGGGGHPRQSKCGGPDDWFTGLNAIALNGIQAYVPVQAPVNFAGNAIGLGGSASAFANGGANAKFCSK